MEQLPFMFRVASAVLGAALPAFAAPCPLLVSAAVTPDATDDDDEIAEEASNDTVFFHLPLASTNEEANTETTLGMQALLFGNEEEAEQHFVAAIAKDDMTTLPYIGLCLLTRNTVANRAALLDELKQKIEAMPATPVEAFYLSAFLKMLEKQLDQAASEWTGRADRFQGDHFSAAWAIVLLHYSNLCYDSEGRVLPKQEEAITRAKDLLARLSGTDEEPLACYLRALVEENAPQISEDALAAAEKLCELLPMDPVAHHLHGHLLFRCEKYEEAANAFQLVENFSDNAKGKDLSYLRARYYRSVALWCQGKNREALNIRLEMNKMTVEDELSKRGIFLCWESHTLPSRLLILRKEAPGAGEIKAALRTFVPKDKENDMFTHAALCITNALWVRYHCSNRHRKMQGITYLQRAEEQLKKFEDTREQVTTTNLRLLTPWERLHQACVIAVNKAKSELYPDTADAWNENIITASRPSESALPPVVPHR